MSASQPSTQTPSLATLFDTLVPVAVVAIAGFTAFLLLRPKFDRIYAPRTFLSTLRPQEKSPKIRSSIFGGIADFLKIPDTYVLNHHSIDGYFFLRYLRVGCGLILVGCCITFPILWPVYATAEGPASQLETISLTKITGGPNNNPRLYATVLVGWVYFGFVWYTIYREMIYYINLRQAYLLSPLYANRISSRTVLYTAVPEEYCNEAAIRRMFARSPPQNVWITSDTKELTELVEDRTSAALKLEGAETKLIKMANDNRLKALKKNPSRVEEEHADAPADIDGESGSAAGRWVEPKKRPTHRLKPLIGKKVDTINWCREQIARLTPKIDKEQAIHRAHEGKPVGAVFVQFRTQDEAQAAYQCTTHHKPLHMAPRFIGMSPKETIWSNLRIKWWERLVRRTGTLTAVILLLIFWAIPVAGVGLISNVFNLLPKGCAGPNADDSKANGPQFMMWLCFITYLPKVLFGLIQGLLPSVLLAVLMALVPIFLRFLAKLGGAPTLSAVELHTQNWYFAFQVIEVFIVGTIGSAASSVATTIAKTPMDTPNLLAAKIPTAANLYMSYVIVQGFSIFWGQLLQIAGLVLFKLLGKLLDNTPRKMYTRWMSLSSLGWGSLFPMYEFFVMISIIYSVMAPLVLGWSLIGLFLIYQAFRYNMIFTTNSQIETHGLVYIQALKHITVALYVAEVTMVGILAVSYAIGPVILMAVFLVASILFHMSLNKAMGPLFDTLPTSLSVYEEHLQIAENGNGATGETTNGTNGVQASNGNGVTDVHSHGIDGHEKGTITLTGANTAAPHKKPNFLTKWLRPDRYADFETLRRLVPTDFAPTAYPAEIERMAYYDPSVVDEPHTIWIPRDTMGISRQEVAHTSKVIDCTDEDATFDDKGKIVIDNEKRPPIYEEKIYY